MRKVVKFLSYSEEQLEMMPEAERQTVLAIRHNAVHKMKLGMRALAYARALPIASYDGRARRTTRLDLAFTRSCVWPRSAQSSRWTSTAHWTELVGWPLSGWPLASWPLAGWPPATTRACIRRHGHWRL